MITTLSMAFFNFFRRPTVEPLQRRLLSLHSQFRLRGRTEAQCLEENSEDMRLDPYFVRKPWPQTRKSAYSRPQFLSAVHHYLSV